MSTKEGIYATLPKSLTTKEVLVRARTEDPETLKQRQQLTQSKSVSELAHISGLSDFPIPANIEKILSGKKRDETRRDPEEKPKSLYDTLPKSMKSECLVRSRLEDPDVLKERQNLVQCKSVGELAKVSGLSDVPIPATIENIIQGKAFSGRKTPEPGSRPESPRGEGIYATLPKGLKTELHVRSKVSGHDEEVMKQRREAVESKSPAELAQINSFSEIPVPAWFRGGGDNMSRSESRSKSAHELGGSGIYETLPKSLKEPALVRSRMEDPELQERRAELTRSKTPSQLAAFHGLGDIPIPGRSEKKALNQRKEKSAEAEEEERRRKQESRINTLPASLIKPCVVRSKVEKEDTLRKRQQIQQSKSVHELSKITNVNEFPLPFKIPLPDIPLPKPTKIFKLMKKKPAPPVPDYEETLTPTSMSPISPDDRTDDELLRYEASSIEGDTTHREQDFGYELIEQQATGAEIDDIIHDEVPQQQQQQQQQDVAVVEGGLNIQYRGTPEREKKIPSRSNKRRPQQQQQQRHSQEVQQQQQQQQQLEESGASPPPPLPPKQPGGKREEIIDDEEEEDDDLEVVPVKGILTLEATNGNVHVVKNEFKVSKWWREKACCCCWNDVEGMNVVVDDDGSSCLHFGSTKRIPGSRVRRRTNPPSSPNTLNPFLRRLRFKLTRLINYLN